MAWGKETNIKGPPGTTEWDGIANKPATFPPTLPIPSSGVTGLDAKQAAQDAVDATKLDASAYTAADVMAKVQTLDGPGSGLDADLLDGQDGAWYRAWANLTGKPSTFPPTLPIAESDVTNLVTDLAAKQATSAKGQANGYASLDATSKVPAAQLPSYVDDVLEFANLAAFPATGTAGIIYIALDTNKVYRWGGSSYTEISPSPGSTDAVPEGTTNKYYTDTRAQAANAAAIGLKADAASPTFTGDPKAPTPTAGDNDTSIATTAFVTTALASSASATSVSDTPPASPKPGQLWYESDSGNTFIWFDDGNSQQWVQVNVPNVSGLSTSQARNRIVNSAMQFSQENGTVSQSTSGSYPADQWMLQYNGLSSFAQKVVSTDPRIGPAYISLGAPTTAKPSLAVTDYAFLNQSIEGLKIADLYWGSPSAKPIIARFAANASVAGTYAFVVRNGGGTRSYVVPIALTTAVKTLIIPIPGCTDGTWPVDNTQAMTFAINGAAGTNWQTTPNQWVAGNFLGFPGMANFANTASQSIAVGQVGLYLDDGSGIPPVWELPDHGQDLINCRRYFEKGASGFNGYASAVTTFSNCVYMVEKRVSPALTLANLALSNLTPAAGNTAMISGNAMFKVYRNSVAAGAIYMDDQWTANARM